MGVKIDAMGNFRFITLQSNQFIVLIYFRLAACMIYKNETFQFIHSSAFILNQLSSV